MSAGRRAREPHPRRVGRVVAVVAGGIAAATAIAVAVAGCDGAPAGREDPAQSSSATAAAPGIDTAVQARTNLQQLTVLAERPDIGGYQRGCGTGQACSFGPAWTDDTTAPGSHNGCGTRDDVLAAQLTSVELRQGSRCVVESGVLLSPYTATTVQFRKADASAVQIDHVVPLALAWDLGAAGWPQARRDAYANDMDLVLLAVDQHSNESKGDSGPAGWMPANRAYWCAYDQRIVTILYRYGLAVTAADKAALTDVLGRC